MQLAAFAVLYAAAAALASEADQDARAIEVVRAAAQDERAAALGAHLEPALAAAHRPGCQTGLRWCSQ